MMIKKIIVFATLFLLCPLTTYGDNSGISSKLLWEPQPQGVSFGIALKRSTKILSSQITFCIKNISTRTLQYYRAGVDHGCSIFIIDGSKSVLLHQQSRSHAMPSNKELKPGDTLVYEIEITPNDLRKLISFPIKCQFDIFDVSGEGVKHYLIESTPRIIQQIPEHYTAGENTPAPTTFVSPTPYPTTTPSQ